MPVTPDAAPPRRRLPALGANQLTLLASVLLATVYSLSFWKRLAGADLPPGLGGALFLVAAGVLVAGFNALLLSLFGWRHLQKPLLALLFVLAALGAYFMDGYGAVIDRHALQSVFETDLREGSEWLSWRMAGYVLVLGLLPALLVVRLQVRYRPFLRELGVRLLFMAALLAVMAAAVLPFSRTMASTARNHAELRYLMAPANLFNAVKGYVADLGPATATAVAPLGRDARAGLASAAGAPPLLVIVVGESARASSFSLGGYARPTNPELAALDIDYFGQVSSCGTNTATSLPCMFSNLDRADYDAGKGRARENLVDVLGHAGFPVEWEDNNTGSKTLAARTREEDMQDIALADLCDDEGCLDEVLVRHLQHELSEPSDFRVFVLHQIGSHGPAYFRRYPPEFERFAPACRSVSLQACSPEEVRNAYDNTILYTDHILARLIGVLQAQAGDRPAALVYLSDHGESTGESGLYLHGAPYLLAPEEQTRVPMLLWTSPEFRAWRQLDPACVARRRDAPLSHDNFFHTVLGLMDVRTQAYRRELDALAGCAPA